MKRTVACFGALVGSMACSSKGSPTAASDTGAKPQITAPTIWLQTSSSIDPTKLPLRDKAYVTDAPKKGFMFVCDPKMFQQVGGPGAKKLGGWLDVAGGTYDMTKKVFVQGNVHYDDARVAITTTTDQRMITANGLPLGVPTGVFPVSRSDPAFEYDPNPNNVTVQDISFAVPRNPTIAASPACTYKQVGITLDGIQLHSPLDSEGRDELAYQLQDVCMGAPQPGGAYHRHALSECTPGVHDKSVLLGYALDGFGIFSPYDQSGKELTSADLDECHGTISNIEWEGRIVSMYHYVMTRDFPYSVACFRGTPTRNAFPALPGAPPEH